MEIFLKLIDKYMKKADATAKKSPSTSAFYHNAAKVVQALMQQ
jgi:hypothetical protein